MPGSASMGQAVPSLRHTTSRTAGHRLQARAAASNAGALLRRVNPPACSRRTPARGLVLVVTSSADSSHHPLDGTTIRYREESLMMPESNSGRHADSPPLADANRVARRRLDTWRARPCESSCWLKFGRRSRQDISRRRPDSGKSAGLFPKEQRRLRHARARQATSRRQRILLLRDPRRSGRSGSSKGTARAKPAAIGFG